MLRRVLESTRSNKVHSLGRVRLWFCYHLVVCLSLISVIPFFLSKLFRFLAAIQSKNDRRVSENCFWRWSKT